MSRRSLFQKPESTKLYLSDGFYWVEVKKRLSGGEKRRLATAGLTDVRGSVKNPDDDNQTIGVDFAAVALARVKTYIVDWNFVNAEGKPQPLTHAAIEALEDDVMVEIEKLLDDHIKATDEEKKLTNSAPSSETASPSVGT